MADKTSTNSDTLPFNANPFTKQESLYSVLAIIPLILLLTRLVSGRASEKAKHASSSNLRSPWQPPYWVPFFGHLFAFMWNGNGLMEWARDRSEGIYSLHMAGKRIDVVTDPMLVKHALGQKQSSLPFEPVAWAISKRFFGLPNNAHDRLLSAYDDLTNNHSMLMKDPSLDTMVTATITNLQSSLPSLISFASSPIDQHPWETWAQASPISPSTTDLNLMGLCRDVLGQASVPALFGRALLDNYPDILHDIYALDAGMMYFLMGLPSWVPWVPSMRAHFSRNQVRTALTEFHAALDAVDGGGEAEAKWGDMSDVSEYIRNRNRIMRDLKITPYERADLPILWALVANANLMVYWHLLHVLACPGLVSRIRSEIAPYAITTPPVTIGSHASAPGLTLDHDGLAKKCPLLRSSFLEACRLSVQDWSVREIAEDVVLRGKEQGEVLLKKGGMLTIPHNMHMLDARYFSAPLDFQPERFIVEEKEDDETGGSPPRLTTTTRTIRPFGGGASMCKGRVLAERECLAFVAGVLALWDFEPVDERSGRVKGSWTIPRQVKTTAVSLPERETRVRVRRRCSN